MSVYFIDTQARELFIDGLIEVISLIFPIENDKQKTALYNELKWLRDHELVEKQKIIEWYLDEESQVFKSSINILMKKIHAIDEAIEKESVPSQSNFAF